VLSRFAFPSSLAIGGGEPPVGSFFGRYRRTQVGNHLLQNFDEAPSLRLFAGAPSVLSSAFVREFILEPAQCGRVSILIELPYVLMRKNVPMVLGAHGNP
jgi:hypothetical protein